MSIMTILETTRSDMSRLKKGLSHNWIALCFSFSALVSNDICWHSEAEYLLPSGPNLVFLFESTVRSCEQEDCKGVLSVGGHIVSQYNYLFEIVKWSSLICVTVEALESKLHCHAYGSSPHGWELALSLAGQPKPVRHWLHGRLRKIGCESRNTLLKDNSELRAQSLILSNKRSVILLPIQRIIWFAYLRPSSGRRVYVQDQGMHVHFMFDNRFPRRENAFSLPGGATTEAGAHNWDPELKNGRPIGMHGFSSFAKTKLLLLVRKNGKKPTQPAPQSHSWDAQLFQGTAGGRIRLLKEVPPRFGAANKV